MTILPEQFAAMMTWQFVLSSVVTGFIINVLAGIFLRKTIEMPSVFKYRRLEQLKRQFELTSKLHASSNQLLCFSFRGLGLSLALLILSSGILSIPINAIGIYYNIQFMENPPPAMPVIESMIYETGSIGNIGQLRQKQIDQNAKTMIAYNEKMKTYNNAMLAYNDKANQANRNTFRWFSVFLLIGSLIGAASFVYAIGLYRTLYMVENFQAMEKQAGALLSEDSD